MPRLEVWNPARNAQLVARGEVAAGFWLRLKGLLGRERLGCGEGLWLKGEQAIHTWGMRFAIDVAYLDRDHRILWLRHSMPPWRWGPLAWKAASVLELPAGTLAKTGTLVGDCLIFTISG